MSIDRLKRNLDELEAAARGRGVPTPPVTVIRVPGDPKTLEQLAVAGVSRAVHSLPTESEYGGLGGLDEFTRVAEQMSGVSLTGG